MSGYRGIGQFEDQPPIITGPLTPIDLSGETLLALAGVVWLAWKAIGWLTPKPKTTKRRRTSRRSARSETVEEALERARSHGRDVLAKSARYMAGRD